MPRGWLDQDGFEGRHYCSLARLSRVVTSTRSLTPTQYPLLLFLLLLRILLLGAIVGLPRFGMEAWASEACMWLCATCLGAFTSSHVIVSVTFPFRTEDDWAMIPSTAMIVDNNEQ